jgi:hypothetical protein
LNHLFVLFNFLKSGAMGMLFYFVTTLQVFLEAGIGHDGAYPNGFSPWQAWMAYNHILCLVEAAYRLYSNQQTACVLTTLSRQPAQFAEELVNS